MARAGRRKRRWPRRLVLGALGLAGLSIACVLTLPNLDIVQEFLFDRLAQWTGLSVQTDKLRVDLVAGKIWASRIRLSGKGGEDLLGVAFFQARFRPTDLVRGQVLLREVRVERPRVWVTFPATGEPIDNWTRAIDAASGPPEPAGLPSGGDALPVFHASDVHVRDAMFEYRDEAEHVTVRLDGIDVESDFDIVGPSAAGRVQLDGGEIVVDDLRIPLGPTTGRARWTGDGLEDALVDSTSGGSRIHATGTMAGILEGTTAIDAATDGEIDAHDLAGWLGQKGSFEGRIAASGPFRLRGQTVEMDLAVSSPSLAAAGLPVRDLAGHFALAGERVTLDLAARVRDLPVTAAGSIEPGGLHALEASLGPVEAGWLSPFLGLGPLDGRLSARAASAGALAEPRVEAGLQGTGLGAGPFRLGDLLADLQGAGGTVKGKLHASTGPLAGLSLAAEARTPTKDLFRLPERLSLTILATGRDMDPAAFLPSFPLAGHLSFDYAQTGLPPRIEGAGTLTVEGGAIEGMPFHRLTASLRTDAAGLTADPLILEMDPGTSLLGRVRATWRGSGEGTLAADQVPLAAVARRLGTTWEVEGGVSLAVQAFFTPEGWQGKAEARIVEARVEGESLGDFFLSAVGTQDQVEIRANGLMVGLVGSIVPAKGGEFDLRARLQGARFAPLLSRKGFQVDEAVLDADVEAKGRLDDPLAAKGQVEIDRLVITQGDRTLTLPRPARLEIADRAIRAEPFQVLVAGLPVHVKGAVSREALDLEAGGEFDLASLALATTLFRSSEGTARGEIRATGSPSAPRLSGELVISGARLTPRRAFPPVEDLEAVVRFEGERIRLEQATARMGDGRFRLSGEVGLRGVRPETISASLQAAGIRYVRTGELRLTVAADLTLEGPIEAARLAGTIDVQKGRYEKNVSLIRELLAPTRSIEVKRRWEVSLLDGLALDLSVSTPGTLRIENNLVSLDLRGDVRLTGTLAEPLLEGRIDVQKGRWTYLGPDFEIKSGSLEFNDPYRIEPTIEVEAQTQIRGYLVTLRIEGPLDEPNPPELAAIPALDPEEILSLLVGGALPGRVPTAAGETQRPTGSPAAAAGLATGVVGTPLKELTGLDLIAIEQAPDAGGGAIARVGKKVGERTNLTYSYPIGSTEPAEIQAEVQLTDRLFVVGTEDTRGRVGFDLRFRLELP